MKVRRGKTAILVLFAFLMMVIIIGIGVAFVAESTVSNFSKDCKSFDQILSCMSQFIQKDMYRTGKAPEQGDFLCFGDDLLDENTVLFVLDGKNKVVACSKNDVKAPDYASIAKDDFYQEDESDIINHLISGRAEVVVENNKVNQVSLVSAFQELNFLLGNKSYIWYEKKFPTMGGSTYKVLARRPAYLSEESSSAVFISIAIFVVISSLFFITLVIIISLQAYSEHRLRKVAYYDMVTNSYNLSRFKMLSKKLLKKKKNKNIAVILLDINDFGVIKDLYGHRKADSILRKIVVVLRNNVSKVSIFARTYGEQFVIMTTFESMPELKERIKRIDQLVHAELTMGAVNYKFGTYCVEDREISVDRMMVYASMALVSVADDPHERIVFYDEKMRETSF